MSMKESDMTQEKERPAGSQSLFRGLMLIEILSNYPNGCPLAHLSELAGLNKSTVHRLLQGLQSCGYVTPAPAAGSYRLTTKFIAVGQKALSSLNIIHVAAPHLESLNIATGETVNFSSREDDHAILIYKLEPTTGMLRTRAYIGQHMPLYCSAMGKIYMAFGHQDYVVQDLAEEGMTMVIVTHEIGFAEKVASRLIFIDKGRIAEDGNPQALIANPPSQRLQEFLQHVS